ncbi:2-dehydropantoate 2-reductase [bacterium]|nr:2-dehydropantoate 2-reductase [bacterium]
MKDDGRTRERVLVMGSGALGVFFGGRLAQAGVDVVFVARGATLEALRRDGLRIASARGVERVAPLRAVATPAEAGPRSVVLVCVKSYDTDAAAAALRPVVGPDTIVLSLQNGIENEARLAAALDLPPLLGGLTHIGAELVAPGVVQLDSGGRIIFGELDGRPSARVARLEALFAAAGVDHRASRHIAVMLWDKLAWNAAFNATTAVTQRTVGALLADADGRALVRAAMLEVVAVAQANGVPLAAARVDASLRHSAEELAALKTSMLQDRQRGRRLEYDALNGAVLRAAARHGVPTPVNRVLHDLLAVLDPRP